ncbi:hypothetical protein GPECTOR_11g121 [Gonium pectorale]|uniref:Uncharacterized protein n=1 Tax=Gonium pectorale TaxID=33097 RepID=A0A150GPA2_GONPE|nr:hypothetical protein GPECTOR_11g121 [Gonium pectorale]|eukprot:KXZ51669.1 hypothetical protein GPECTOR_11g121 [Gonium pectorale]
MAPVVAAAALSRDVAVLCSLTQLCSLALRGFSLTAVATGALAGALSGLSSLELGSVTKPSALGPLLAAVAAGGLRRLELLSIGSCDDGCSPVEADLRATSLSALPSLRHLTLPWAALALHDHTGALLAPLPALTSLCVGTLHSPLPSDAELSRLQQQQQQQLQLQLGVEPVDEDEGTALGAALAAAQAGERGPLPAFLLPSALCCLELQGEVHTTEVLGGPRLPPGGLEQLELLVESIKMEKRYFATVDGDPGVGTLRPDGQEALLSALRLIRSCPAPQSAALPPAATYPSWRPQPPPARRHLSVVYGRSLPPRYLPWSDADMLLPAAPEGPGSQRADHSEWLAATGPLGLAELRLVATSLCEPDIVAITRHLTSLQPASL